jgi:hypothetical protein
MLESRLTRINHSANISDPVKKYQPLIFLPHPDAPKDSIIYEDWLEEIEDYCINGFKPKGMSKITGKHFTFLNLCPIKLNDPEAPPQLDRKILSLPFYRDMDHLYYSIMEECKADRQGMIVGKARDKGFSMLNAAAATQELLFFEGNEIGVAAGLDSTTTGLRIKIENMLDNMWTPFRQNFLKNNSKEITTGFKLNDEKLGYQSTIYSRTIANPNVFKGERVSLMIFEEAGEIDKLKEAYEASKPCFMDGSSMFGLPIVGGTGGNIEGSSKGFMQMWNNHDAFYLRKVFIPATMVYKGFFDFSTGKSDIENARKDVISKRVRLFESGDTEAYNLHVQNYPLEESEIFLKTKGGLFDIIKINGQRQNLMMDPNLKDIIEHGHFVWDDTTNTYDTPVGHLPHDLKRKIRVTHGSTVRFVQKKNGPVQILYHPLEVNKSASGQLIDIMGVDSVDQEYAETTDSKMAGVVYRRWCGINNIGQLPVSLINMRTSNPADCYEQLLMQAIYYDTKALVEYSKIRILDFWSNWGAANRLKERPEAILKSGHKNKNQYGVYMTPDVKNQGIDAIKVDISTGLLEDIYFMDLLDDLANAGNKNADMFIAYLLCKLYELEMSIKPIDISSNNVQEDEYKFPTYKFVNGKRVAKHQVNEFQS